MYIHCLSYARKRFVSDKYNAFSWIVLYFRFSARLKDRFECPTHNRSHVLSKHKLMSNTQSQMCLKVERGRGWSGETEAALARVAN